MLRLSVLESSALFGSKTRTALLVTLLDLQQSYVTELATALDRSPVTVWRMVQDLEREGVVSTMKLGSARTVELNPRFPAAEELKAVLRVLSRRDPEAASRLAGVRRAPRRIGKPL
jgi:predicted transcriptional regulator